MGLSRAQFEALVERMERLARARPQAYRRRVFLLAALGYAYLATVVVVLGCLSAAALYAVIYLKIAAVYLFFPVAGLFVLVLRALWIRFKRPEGISITPEQAPDLFALIDELRGTLKIPSLDEVLITGDFNAAIVQLPRLGLFGWHRNYLLLGLPLMKSVNVPQLRSVLAHELGHLSHGHGRKANWIYGLRLMWSRVETAVRTQASWGSAVVQQFCAWYVPYFNACTFPLARSNEYQADAAAVRLTDARSTAQALTAANVIGRFVSEQYWPAIHAAARDEAEPTFTPYAGFHAGLMTEAPRDKLDDWLTGAMNASTNCNDTHPSLRDRLAAIGAAAELVLPAAGSGSESLLGTCRQSVEKSLDDEWTSKIAPVWKSHYEQTQKRRTRLTTLRALAATPTPEQELERAQLEEELGEGAEAALSLRRALLQQHPDSIPVRFALGRQLILRKDAEGATLLQAVVEGQPQIAAAAAELLRDFYWNSGAKETADRWHQRLTRGIATLQAAKKERERLSPDDGLLPHALTTLRASELRLQLSALKRLRFAYLVRKEVRLFPEQPLYVLAFGVRGPPWGHRRTQIKQLLEEMRQQIQWPGQMLMLALDAQRSTRLRRRIRRVATARIL